MSAAVLACVAAISATTDASAFAVKKTSTGELVHWESRTVEYAIAPAVSVAVDGSLEATVRAMRDWSGTVGAPELTSRTTAEQAPNKPGFDEKNGIFFVPGGYAPAGRALAITILTYDNASGRILDADIVFNGAYQFTVHHEAETVRLPTEGIALSSTDGISHEERSHGKIGTYYDLHHVVAHELGHSLGMNDEMDRRDALMYRYTPPNDPGVRAPTPDDIEGLAELYGTELSAHGNGCGGATVAPKKPSLAATHGAMFAVFGLLVFLALRARGDRRARVGFVVASAVAALALLPSVSPARGVARASTLAAGHARAKVTKTMTTLEDGLLRTTFALATTACRASTCPQLGHGAVWGGVSGNIRQDVGGQHAPVAGDEVDVTFASLPSALAPLSAPLGGRSRTDDVEVRVLTPAH